MKQLLLLVLLSLPLLAQEKIDLGPLKGHRAKNTYT